jgi:S1-C subfamily serine protease
MGAKGDIRVLRVVSTLAGAFCALAVLVGASVPARAQTGFLGLEIQGAGDARAIGALGAEFKDGVFVKDVAVGEPAAIAGFRRGDRIVEFDGAKIGSFDDLMKVVGKTKPDQTIVVGVMRADKKINLTLRTTARPPAWSVTTSLFANYPELGFTVAGITDEARKQFSLPWGSVGLVVTIIEEKSLVASGLHVGDVIVQANLRDIWEPRQLTREIEEALKGGKTGVLALVAGKGGYRYSVIPVK